MTISPSALTLLGDRVAQFQGRCEPTTGGCVEWTGGRDADGYGLWSIWIPDMRCTRTFRTHRVAWELHFGRPLTTEQKVCHHCDNPPCVNVSHLFIGSTADNHADCVAKGRQARGETSGKAKFTEADVVAVRVALLAGESTRQIAARFGCSLSRVEHVKYRRCWAWL